MWMLYNKKKENKMDKRAQNKKQPNQIFHNKSNRIQQKIK